MCSTTIIEFPTLLSVMNVLQKLLFHGQEYLRAAARSGPLSYCFGITLLLERNLLPFELLFRYCFSLGEESPALRVTLQRRCPGTLLLAK